MQLKTSQSPRKVLQIAYATACRALLMYAHCFSPRKVTQPQLFACLALKEFLEFDYRRRVGHCARPRFLAAFRGGTPRLCSPSLLIPSIPGSLPPAHPCPLPDGHPSGSDSTMPRPHSAHGRRPGLRVRGSRHILPRSKALSGGLAWKRRPPHRTSIPIPT